jgi:hypothetical protein
MWEEEDYGRACNVSALALFIALFLTQSAFIPRRACGVRGAMYLRHDEGNKPMKLKQILLIALTAIALGLASLGGAAPASAASKGGAAGDVIRR